MDETYDLEPLFPDRDCDEPLGRQFVRRLRHAIESGRYAPSSRLLPSRELARRLGLGRNTVTAAIEQLIAEGYLESRVGSGTFVVARVARAAGAAGTAPRALPATARRFEPARNVLRGYAMGSGPLRVGVPDPASFPLATWGRLTRRSLAELPGHLDYGDSRGDRRLREAIAQHVQQFRGVSAEPNRVIVVEGTQAAIRLVSDVLLREGDTVVVEDPTYPFARASFEARDLRPEPVPVDEDGMDVALAPAARVAYVSPSHQFPLGVTMSVARRRALLEWANEYDAYVIEDDYDSEYVFDAKPLPPLQSIDRQERVIYVGTFSKTLAPALRLGYLIVPQHLAELFSVARLVSTLGGTRYVQATLAAFLSEGHFARHVRRMTQTYGERRRVLAEMFEAGLRGCGFRLAPANAGLHLTAIAPPGFDDIAVVDELRVEGVRVQPLSAFCVERTDCRGFVVGYSAAPMAEIERDARILIRVAARRAAFLN
jgi:GntR family transcriptional regulator/MocR family aminotransferase